MSKENSSGERDRNDPALSIQGHLVIYEGLEITEGDSMASSHEEDLHTILVAEWIRPEWADRPLLRITFPEMGYVSYGESPLLEHDG